MRATRTTSEVNEPAPTGFSRCGVCLGIRTGRCVAGSVFGRCRGNGANANEGDAQALKLLFEEITTRLRYLHDVGIGYLTLDRQSRTLSGGEVQRISHPDGTTESFTY
ncbi:MAG: hypothetical protein IE935_14945, partial [Micrococcales bacterium]|nr:hypothetical protein [Micrococcales bacterium]